MKESVVIWGLGQMGGAFAHALLKAGHTVHPVNRDTDVETLAAAVEAPALCLLAVGEKDLAEVVPRIPAAWRDRIGLLQNELLPGVWRDLGVEEPTVAVVWFEKKKKVPITPVQSTPIGGPRAGLLVAALEGLSVPAHEIQADALRDALVEKNLYILTANVAALAEGVPAGATVAHLLADHRDVTVAIARDALAIQAQLTGEALPDSLLDGLWRAFKADPGHVARGRSAEARLKRALAIADEASLDVPALRAISEQGA